MEHISAFITFRKENIERERQLGLFDTQSQKGSREWAAFNSVREDRTDAYRVALPRIVHVPVHSFRGSDVRLTVPILRHAH